MVVIYEWRSALRRMAGRKVKRENRLWQRQGNGGGTIV